MKCSSFKHSGSETKILTLGDTKAHISPKIRSPQLLLMGRAPKSLPTHRAHHWATPTCHSSHKTLATLYTSEKHKQNLSNKSSARLSRQGDHK
jgi:hypothetical protein